MVKTNVTKEDLVNIFGKVLKYTGMALGTSLAAYYNSKMGNRNGYVYYGSSERARPHRYSVTGYGDAIEAIGDSDMWSADKRIAIGSLAKNESDDFYDGVISIVNSGMWSADKKNAILEMSKQQLGE